MRLVLIPIGRYSFFFVWTLDEIDNITINIVDVLKLLILFVTHELNDN